MCIKNVNATSIVFEDSNISGSKMLFEKQMEVPSFPVDNSKENLFIDNLCIFTNFSIIDGVDHYLTSKVKGLKVKLRLAQTKNKEALFMDLDEFDISFSADQIIRKPCIDFINIQRVTNIDNLSVPYVKNQNEYVLKILLKEKFDEEVDSSTPWIIQSSQLIKWKAKEI